jgi:Leucine-rich repeat (LRR) protein
MLPACRLLTLVILATADSSLVRGQTIAQDCAIANTVWRKMGQSSLIPSNCCSQTYGIECSDSRIIRLRWDWRGLKNSIPSEIGQLTGLRSLVLAANQLTGTIPSTLGDLVELRHIALDNNQLSGSIPSSLGNLPYLGYLYIQNNQLSGNIPSSFGNITNLGTFWLFRNGLTGYPSSLFSLKNLTNLYIS